MEHLEQPCDGTVIQETMCSARDPSPQQSASSDRSANRAGIIPPESHRPARFYTA